MQIACIGVMKMLKINVRKPPARSLWLDTMPLPETMFCAQQIKIPPELPDILKQFTKAAIRTQPFDVLQWAAANVMEVRCGCPCSWSLLGLGLREQGQPRALPEHCSSAAAGILLLLPSQPLSLEHAPDLAEQDPSLGAMQCRAKLWLHTCCCCCSAGACESSDEQLDLAEK
ncbi:hypothetical protein EK904_008439 [Melospiza melodia maxima]|nr:hypothetical protein EK904_008439 [Melospiza melodia maxima]